ncbi:MAG: MAPEG family protein [Halomonadaceae bacterium]|nr:MAG: MAPEG family protein [Halomonadaceae bacterium]
MDPVIYWYAVATVILFVKMLAISVYQGYHRIGKQAFKTPEDAAFMGRKPLAEELPQVQRGARAWLNDLENIPAFWALGAVYIFVGASATAAAWLFMIFTVARVLHTVFYLCAVQPWRTLAYAVALLCLFGMVIQILLVLS